MHILGFPFNPLHQEIHTKVDQNIPCHSVPGINDKLNIINHWISQLVFSAMCSFTSQPAWCLRSLGYCSEQRNSAYLSIIIVHQFHPIQLCHASLVHFGTRNFYLNILELRQSFRSLERYGNITRKHYSASAIDSCTSQGSQECLSKISKLHVIKLYSWNMKAPTKHPSLPRGSEVSHDANATQQGTSQICAESLAKPRSFEVEIGRAHV